MRPRLHHVWWIGPLALLACRQPPDISGDIEDYANAVSDANAIACDCPQNLGYGTIVECDEALGPIGTGERDCITGVLDGHEDAAADYLPCASDAYQAYYDCLEANVSCDQPTFDNCTDEHEAALAACPALPSSVESSFDACVM